LAALAALVGRHFSRNIVLLKVTGTLLRNEVVYNGSPEHCSIAAWFLAEGICGRVESRDYVDLAKSQTLFFFK
jgi:hypothetical protein